MKHRELLKVKHLVKILHVLVYQASSSQSNVRGFLKGVGVFCCSPSPGICSGLRVALSPASGAVSRAPTFFIPPHPQALHVLFYYKTHLHRVHIKIPFPAANCAIHRHLHLPDHTSSLPLMSWFSSPRLALLAISSHLLSVDCFNHFAAY